MTNSNIKTPNPNRSTSRRRSKRRWQQQQMPQVTVNVPMPSPSPHRHWRDSPITIAALTALSTAAFWHNVIFPLHDVTQKDQLASFKEEASKVPALTKKITNLESRLWHAEHFNAFDNNSAYPDGFKAVKIGDPVEGILSVFDVASIEKIHPRSWSVNDQHSIFKRVHYYFDDTKANQPVTHMVFYVSLSKDSPYLSILDEQNAKTLNRRLIDTYGEPEVNKSKEMMKWLTKDGVNLFQTVRETIFVIMGPTSQPVFWSR